jgi:hypothetical protein
LDYEETLDRVLFGVDIATYYVTLQRAMQTSACAYILLKAELPWLDSNGVELG